MKANITLKYGSPATFAIKDIDIPIAKDKQVLIKIHATTVTRGDVMLSKLPLMVYMPLRLLFGVKRHRVLGHEFAGTVESVGESVTNFKVGDAVFGTPTYAESGTHTEYIAVPEDGILAHKPDNITFEQAAATPVGSLTALQILRNGGIQAGQDVMIYGASGSVGSNAVQIAKYLGATVTGVAGTSNLDMVTALGADHVIDYKQEDITTLASRYDVVFDAVGKLKPKDGKNLLKSDGKFVSVNTNTTEKLEDLLFIQQMIEDGKLTAMIDRRYTLNELPTAYEYVASGRKRGNVIVTI